jgi:hypothetical protein
MNIKQNLVNNFRKTYVQDCKNQTIFEPKKTYPQSIFKLSRMYSTTLLSL